MGTSSTQTVTLRNTGTALLSLNGIAVTGTDAADFKQTSSCGATVAAGANCTISVTFTPAASGTLTASLTLTDNASGSPQALGLNGTGGSVTAAHTFYVAPNGNDNFSGTLSAPNATNTDGPFATLTKAQTAVESAIGSATGPVTVEIRAGTYYLSSPLNFSSADSGTPAKEITWEGFPGDTEPVISGGARLTGWKNTSGNTWTVAIPSSFNNFEALYYNGVRRFRPRTTSGYLTLNPVVVPSQQPNCTVRSQGGYECFDRFSFTPGDLQATYHNINDVEIIDFEEWTVSRMRLASVDTANNIAYLTGPTTMGTFFGFLPSHRYLVENVKESLSQAGQWYLDRATTPWTLTYLANSGENPNNDTVIVPQQPQLLVASGLQFVTFQGLAFEHDGYTVGNLGHKGNSGEYQTPAAISFNNCSNVTSNGITIAHTQQWALEFIGTAAAGQGNTVTGSVLYDLGTGGIRIGQIASQTDTDATVAQNDNISNDLVANGGRFLPGGEGTGVWIGSAHDNTVSHVAVHDFYNGAIELGQQPQGGTTYTHDNTIEFNELYDLGQGVTNDMGCVHIVSSNNTGNRILNNVCHDVTHDPGPGGYGGNGIYVDSNVENVTIENNLVYRVSDTAMTTGPRDSSLTISNNIFAFGREGLIRRNIKAVSDTFTAEHNILVYDLGQIQRLGDWFCQAACTSDWLMDYNIYWNTTGAAASFVLTSPSNPAQVAQQFTLAGWQAATGEDLHSLNVNPQLTSPTYPSDNFSLMPNSPAMSSGIGFVPLTTSSAGPTSQLTVPSGTPGAFPLQLLDRASGF